MGDGCTVVDWGQWMGEINRAPFFAHMDIPMMADFAENYRAKFRKFPSDWAVL